MFFFYSLVCGDVCGKFNVLYGRVRNVLKKNKDFEVKQERERENSCIVMYHLINIAMLPHALCRLSKIMLLQKRFLVWISLQKKKSVWAGAYFFSVSSAFFNHCPSNAFFTN